MDPAWEPEAWVERQAVSRLHLGQRLVLPRLLAPPPQQASEHLHPEPQAWRQPEPQVLPSALPWLASRSQTSRRLPALLLRELKVCFLSGSPAALLLGWWMPLPEPPSFLPRASPPGSMPLSAVFHRALVMSLTGPDWSVSKFSYSNLKAKAERIQITSRCDVCHNIHSP
jgi:hypothetical protein